MAWTKAQLDAIETTEKTILVSAAAGSGKTTTLTERIIRKLTDEENPSDISKYLIVTFTKAAASDLKNKISKALSQALAKNPSSRHLNRQMIQLGSAKICTIDSFYSSVVKTEFQNLGLSAGLSVMDGGDRHIMMCEIMESVLEDCYNSKTKNTAFIEFMDIFMDSRGTDKATEKLIRLYERLSGLSKFLQTLLDFAEKLESESEKEFFETRFGSFVREKAGTFFDHAERVLNYANEIISNDEKAFRAYGPAFAYDREHFCATGTCVEKGTYKEAVKQFSLYAPINLSSYRGGNEAVKECKDQRTALLKKYRYFADIYFSHSDEEISLLMKKTAEFCRTAFYVLEQFQEKFSEAKLSRKLCDFNDNKRGALRLFVSETGEPTLLAKEYSERFDAIYIDEYQDTDEVQDMIFAAISRPDNRFMVGDIKQSIYRFRGTDPDVFLSYKTRFPLGDEVKGPEKSVFMSENFRCDKTVIDFVNAVCSYIFTKGKNSIGYVEEDSLVCGKKKIPEERTLNRAVLTVVCGKRKTAGSEIDDSVNASELEMKYVVSEIQRLLTSRDCFCEEKGELRRICPRDIAVLARSNSDANLFASALKKYGIPTNAREAKSYFENPEVLLALSLLCVIDNPQKDVYLAGVLRSPLYDFSMDDLAMIRLAGNKGDSLFDCLTSAEKTVKDEDLKNKIRYFLSKLERYREYAISLSVDKLLRFLYADTSMMSFAGSGMDDTDDEFSERLDLSSSSARANLLLLYDYARQFERGGFKGLYNFIGYIKELIQEKQTIDAPSADGDDNVVNVMTIHHSKGLEFPVVFLVSAQKNFHVRSDGILEFDKNLGIGAGLRDSTGLAFIKNILMDIIKDKSDQDDADEEKRVLYVALTRARERLYVSGHTLQNIDSKAEQRRRFADRYSLDSCSSYLDWILMALPPKSEVCDFNILTSEDIPEPEIISIKEDYDFGNVNREDGVTSLLDGLKERFSFVYEYGHLSDIPAKMSVSRLYPDVLDDVSEGNSLLCENEDIELLKSPQFLLGEKRSFTSAERGTATHAFLQFCDFERTEKNGVNNEIDILCEKGFIDKAFAPIINEKQLEVFFSGSFYRNIIKKSKKLYREQRFNLSLPAKLFTRNEALKDKLSNDKLAVQGVIDIVAELPDGQIFLCDYKTDYLTEAELENPKLAAKKLSERHGLQLSYYSAAIEQIFSVRPSKVLIYSLPLGDAVEINTDLFTM